MEEFNEVPKYRKKKDHRSKSSKRSDHKHEYEPCLIIRKYSFAPDKEFHSIAECCKICERIQNEKWSLFIKDKSIFSEYEEKGYRKLVFDETQD